MNKILKSVQAELSASGLDDLDEDVLAADSQYFAVHKDQLNYLLKICRKHFKPGAKFLDIGSSFGYPCLGAKLIGYDSYGLDLPENVAKFSDRFAYFGVKNVAGDLTNKKSPFSSRKFDVILVSDVPEYVEHNPAQLFGEVARLLKPGGALIITARNLLRFNNVTKIFLAHRREVKVDQAPENYYCEFTAPELAYLLTKNGLNVENIKYRNFNKPVNQRIDWLAKLFNNLSGLFLPHRKGNLVVTARK